MIALHDDADMAAQLQRTLASQGAVLFDALNCEKKFRKFTAAEGGAGHCAGMGQQLWQQAAFGRLGEIASRESA